MSYHQFLAEDGEEYGSFETFHLDEMDLIDEARQLIEVGVDNYEAEFRTERELADDHEFTEEELDELYEAVIDEIGLAPGWYWWACFPGCLPDGDKCGPFKTEQEAFDDARSW